MEEVEDGRAESAVVVLCGLPASGKSTFVARLSHHLQTSPKGVHALALSFDEQYEALKRSPGPFDLDSWHSSRVECKATAKTFLQNGETSSIGRRVLLVDDNMHLASMRQEWFRLARDCRCSYVQLYVKCPLEVCRWRNKGRAGAALVKEDVLLKMDASFDEPAPDKRAWEKSTITIDTSATNTADPQQLDLIWNEILALWGSPPPVPTSREEKEAKQSGGRLANASSLLGAIDDSSRKKLSNTMQVLMEGGMNGSALKQVGRDLNKRRRDMLDRCRKVGPGAPEAALSELQQSFSDACDEARKD